MSCKLCSTCVLDFKSFYLQLDYPPPRPAFLSAMC